MTTLKFIFALFAVLAILSCRAKDTPSVTAVEQLIQQNLKPGDSDAKIVGFLKRNGFPYNFNRFEHRYESGVPKSEETDSKGVQSVTTINIYVDENGSFKKAEVKKAYTYF